MERETIMTLLYYHSGSDFFVLWDCPVVVLESIIFYGSYDLSFCSTG